ncbi:MULTISPECIES: DUF2000 domain-containing protein [Chryseobacterium]|nr:MULTISPECIES: DUF2000 domain-containing protein [Chryseobacterium]
MNIKKCVLIIDHTQPTGIIANTASVLSITLGKCTENIIGHDVYDRQGEKHPGITQIPIPILGATADKIKEIRKNILSLPIEDMVVVDFSDIAQQSKTYDHYESTMLMADENHIRYIGIALYGDKKIINKATGNLSLIR